MKTKKYLSFVFVFILFAIITVPFVTFADGPNGGADTTIPNPFNCGGQANCTLLTLINTILQKIILPIAAVVAVMYIIYAGFKYVQAQGKPAEVQKANERLLWTLIGVGVLLGAAGISLVLQNTVSSLLTH